MNVLSFSPSGRVKEQFNLGGLKIESITLSWAPYLTLGNCDVEGKNCQTVEGLLADYMNILANMFNFTWETWCQFHQHFKSSFYANTLLPKNYKAKL